MYIFHNYPLYALIVSNAVLVFGAAIAMLRFARLVKRNESFWGSPTGTAVRAGSASEAVLPRALEHRLIMLQDQLEELASQNTRMSVPQPTELPIEYALRMAKRGASVEDLTQTCGLNKAEAQLMWRLHSEQRKSQVS